MFKRSIMLITASVFMLGANISNATTIKKENKEVLINELKCEDYLSKKECITLNSNLKSVNLNNFEFVMLDNQLRKIMLLLNKDKENIAKKKYNYLFELLKENLNADDYNKVFENKNELFKLIKKYSKSKDYNPNFKYKKQKINLGFNRSYI